MESRSPSGFRELLIEGGTPAPPLLTVGLPNAEKTRANIGPRQLCSLLFENPSSPRTGSKGAPVRVATFFDYRCAYCRKLTQILSELQQQSPLQVSYKEWPILGDSSVLAARAALAAAKQGQYIEFHTKLMESRLIPTMHHIESIARSLNLDVSRLFREMNEEAISAELERAALLASEFDFQGTPALIVGRTIVRGSIGSAQLKKLIDLEAGIDPNLDVCPQSRADQI